MRLFAYGDASPHNCSKQCCALMAHISEDLGRMDALRTTHAHTLKGLEKDVLIESVEASTHVEGIYPEAGRVAALAKGDVAHDDTDRQIQGLLQAHEYIYSQVDSLPVSPSTILSIYESLFSLPATHRKSRYRKHDTMTMLIDGRPQQIKVSPITAFETPLYVGSACDALAEAFDAAPDKPDFGTGTCEHLLPIPMFTVDFFCIRPFDEGNGRVIRLFAEFLMLKAGLDICRYVSLNRIFEEDGMAYYDALNACTDGWEANMGTYDSFVHYWLDVVHRAYKKLFAILDAAPAGIGRKTERVRMFFEQHHGAFAKRDVLDANPDISISTVENALAELVQDGYLRKIGAGRSTQYERVSS